MKRIFLKKIFILLSCSILFCSFVAVSASNVHEKTADVIMEKISTILASKNLSKAAEDSIWILIAQKIDEIEKIKTAQGEDIHPALPYVREKIYARGVQSDDSSSVSEDPADGDSQETAQQTNVSLPDAMLTRVNEERKKQGIAPLALHPVLTRTAQWHAEYMADADHRSHVQKNGSTPADRAQKEGFSYQYLWENIAWGQKTVDDVVDSWMASPWHKANILWAQFTYLWVWYEDNNWVQVFGTELE